MAGRTYLIVNADDFGQSPGLNRGIIEAYERGIVTSASLMVRWPAAVEAAAYNRAHPDLSLGLHIDLGEWAYRNESWVPMYEVVRVDDITAVAAEVSCQLATFQRLLDKNPTHIDSHQHMHSREPVRSVLSETASRLGLPLRGCDPIIRYCGEFYGQTADGLPLSDRITVDGLIKILTTLPPGLTELACHPGGADDLETMYRSERAQEVRTLCHPIVRTAIEKMGIQLCSFYDAMRFLGSRAFSKKGRMETGSTK
jgi:chitin disaccharide deacetylase